MMQRHARIRLHHAAVTHVITRLQRTGAAVSRCGIQLQDLHVNGRHVIVRACRTRTQPAVVRYTRRVGAHRQRVYRYRYLGVLWNLGLRGRRRHADVWVLAWRRQGKGWQCYVVPERELRAGLTLRLTVRQLKGDRHWLTPHRDNWPVLT